MSRTEQTFNREVVINTVSKVGTIVKIVVANKAGTSDNIACINGRFCAIESKLAYNSMSQLQKTFMVNVVRDGGLSVCAKTLEDVEWIIDMAVNNKSMEVPKSWEPPDFDL